ncbi:hypothetical protein [Georgenia sp. Z1491]|uniref:hypothetical protein n=1 Tax=Georgenia sp. Z1491 TaxID=3416707 RepID=UPI003CFB3DC0
MTRRTTRIMTAATGVLALLAAAGCSGSGADAVGPQLDADGLASYACALAVDAAAGTPMEEIEGYIGPDTAPELIAAGGAAGLLGATTNSPLEGYEDLLEPATTMMQSLQRIDLESLQQSLDDLVTACEGHDLPEGDPDVTEEGRLAQACALVTSVDGDDRPAEEWLEIQAPAGSAESLIMARAGGFSGLGGGLNAWTMPGHEPLSEASTSVVEGLMRLDTEAVDEGAAAGAEYCATL